MIISRLNYNNNVIMSFIFPLYFPISNFSEDVDSILLIRRHELTGDNAIFDASNHSIVIVYL